MSFLDTLKTRWGVSPLGAVAILAAFALAGTTVVSVRAPVLAWLLPSDAPTWLRWLVYLVILVPMYQLFLLAYGAVLGQFHFFWGRIKAVGRALGVHH